MPPEQSLEPERLYKGSDTGQNKKIVEAVAKWTDGVVLLDVNLPQRGHTASSYLQIVNVDDQGNSTIAGQAGHSLRSDSRPVARQDILLTVDETNLKFFFDPTVEADKHLITYWEGLISKLKNR